MDIFYSIFLACTGGTSYLMHWVKKKTYPNIVRINSTFLVQVSEFHVNYLYDTRLTLKFTVDLLYKGQSRDALSFMKIRDHVILLYPNSSYLGSKVS